MIFICKAPQWWGLCYLFSLGSMWLRYKIEVTFPEPATAAPPCSASPNIHGHLSGPYYSPIVLFNKLLLSPAAMQRYRDSVGDSLLPKNISMKYEQFLPVPHTAPSRAPACAGTGRKCCYTHLLIVKPVFE